MTRQAHLQTLWDAGGALIDADIVFRPFQGWFAEPAEARHFDDTGDYLGWDWKEAEGCIRRLTGRH